MKVYFIVLGSSIATWRGDLSRGNTFADGWSEPFLHQAGLSWPRIVAASHRRPFSSNIELWLFARVSQSFSSPKYGDGSSSFTDPACPGPSDSGMLGSRTRILKN